MMTPAFILCVLALLFAVLSIPWPNYPLLAVAVIRDASGENGSTASVRRFLSVLEKRGWIFHMKRTNGRMAIWLQIPPRFRRLKAPDSTISVLSP